MAESRMRSIVRPDKRKDTSSLVSQGTLEYIQLGHHSACISLTEKSSYSNIELLQQLILDYRDGAMAAYTNPKLAVCSGVRPNDIVTWEGSAEQFYEGMKQLHESLVGHPDIYHFAFGENWSKSNPDTLFRMDNDGSHLDVTKRSLTEHLTPFVDARIEGDLVILMDGEAELERKPVESPVGAYSR